MIGAIMVATAATTMRWTDSQYRRAFCEVESGGNYTAVHDRCKDITTCDLIHFWRNGVAYHGYGAYGFQARRFYEYAPANTSWSAANELMQNRTMRWAIKGYRRQAGSRWKTWTDRQRATWLYNCHNIGHGSLRQTKNTRKFIAALERQRKARDTTKPAKPTKVHHIREKKRTR